jgi:hypothetical protein
MDGFQIGKKFFCKELGVIKVGDSEARKARKPRKKQFVQILFLTNDTASEIPQAKLRQHYSTLKNAYFVGKKAFQNKPDTHS